MLRNFVGNPLSVSLLSGAEKVSMREGGGNYQDFLSKNFFLTVPKKIVREPIRVSLISGLENFFCFSGLCHDFRFSVEIFLSHSDEKFRR